MTRGMKAGRALLLGATLGGLLFFAVPASTYSADQDRNRDEKCERKIHKTEENVHKQERKHGEHSRQAESARRHLEDVRRGCHRDHDR